MIAFSPTSDCPVRQTQGAGPTIAAADGDDDVLPSLVHVGHGGAALLSWHVHGAHFLPGGLVVGAQHRTPRTIRGGRRQWIAGEDQRPGRPDSDRAGLARAGNGQPLQRGMVLTE